MRSESVLKGSESGYSETILYNHTISYQKKTHISVDTNKTQNKATWNVVLSGRYVRMTLTQRSHFAVFIANNNSIVIYDRGSDQRLCVRCLISSDIPHKDFRRSVLLKPRPH